MEGSIPSAQIARPRLERTYSELRKADKTDASKATQSALAAHRATKYKDKFLAMKERYEHVTSTHSKYERELAIANEKMRNLQNECNLLLDAVDIAVPGQPSLMHYLQHDPVPVHYATANAVVPEAPMMPLQVPSSQQSAPPAPPPPHHTNGTNGHI
ncbi:hypothetical protein BDY19DRAFT_930455 [Irpex rosettiformis]|uniref:Uncharacterized protein n=1 Tax=Irpex rosettiformis TaxID=378272 RepID=A0ACB8UB02_9APHY|nr:hypothetical protein BDY19DRAFT_930455 [Irpex rosettiformis]